MKHPLDTADELFEQLKKLQPLKPEDQARLDKKFRLEFNYNSNHMEGNTLTYGETELLLIFDDTRGSHSMREYEEMKAHDVAWQMVEEWARDKERPLTEQHIKKLNEILLVRPFWKDAITLDGQAMRRLIKVGDYKEQPNSVRLPNGEIFQYTSPQNTPIEMGELIDWYREEDTVHPITIAAMLHYKFVRIHPFDDGNGRVSRLLMNYVLLKHSYPPVVIKSADKAAYLRALHIADIGDYSELIAYVAEQAVWSLEMAVKAATGKRIEEDNDVDKEIALFKKSLSRKNESTKIKSDDLVRKFLSTSGMRLFSRLISSLANFNELFHDSDIRFIFSDTEGITYDVRSRAGGRMLAINKEFPDSFIDWMLHKNSFQFLQLGIDFLWNGYKRSTPAFELGIFINIRLDKYSYHVEVSSTFDSLEHYLENAYDHPLSEDDIDFTVSQVANAVMKGIKERHYDEE